MSGKLAVLMCTAFASAYANADEAKELETVTVLGQKEHTTAGSRLD